MILTRYRDKISGVLGLVSAVAGFLCWFLPYSPSTFWFGVVGLQAISLMLIVTAGLCNSRWWLAATPVPLLLLLMVPQYEKPTKITLKGDTNSGVSFGLSGTFTLVSFGIYRHSPEMERPNDPRFMVWLIEAADRKNGGETAWKLDTIKYGVVPPGYVQVFPAQGLPPSPLELGKIYHVHADGFFGKFFEIVNGKPQWVRNPPQQPCFTKQQDKWVRAPCSPD